MDQNRISLKINGKQYPIKGEASIDHLFNVGLYVDRAVSAVMRMDASLSTEEAAVLAALNIADAYLKLKGDKGEGWSADEQTVMDERLAGQDKRLFVPKRQRI